MNTDNVIAWAVATLWTIATLAWIGVGGALIIDANNMTSNMWGIMGIMMCGTTIIGTSIAGWFAIIGSIFNGND